MAEKEPWDIPMSASYTFSQSGDSCGGAASQMLKVETADAGGGNFLILSTERWAIDGADLPKFLAILERCLRGKTGLREFFSEEARD